MAVRVTSNQVGEIIDVDSAISLTPFISAANMLVTRCCTDLTVDYTAAELVEIEKWLSAHFYTVRDMRAEMEKAGPVSERKQSKVDLGFATSHYGQMAMVLDYHGGLARLNEQTKNGTSNSVGFTYLGTEDKT